MGDLGPIEPPKEPVRNRHWQSPGRYYRNLPNTQGRTLQPSSCVRSSLNKEGKEPTHLASRTAGAGSFFFSTLAVLSAALGCCCCCCCCCGLFFIQLCTGRDGGGGGGGARCSSDTRRALRSPLRRLFTYEPQG